MTNERKFNKIVYILLTVALIFTTMITYYPSIFASVQIDNAKEYESKLFSENEIIDINIVVNEDEWNDMLENAGNEEYITCDVEINGTTFSTVGIRPKGNSSLSTVLNSDSDRYSFKIKFDEYITDQTCFGLDKLVLNNMVSDATYMKEYISFNLMEYIGVATPHYGYTDIKVNGESWGLYFALEAYEESFVQRVYGEEALADGNLYNVKMSSGMGGDKVNNIQNSPEINNKNENPISPPDNVQGDKMNNNNFRMGGFGGGNGGDLVYKDDDSSSYASIFENAVLDSNENDYQKMINAIENLSEGENLEKYFDIDQILRYFAAHTVLVNLDSYISNMQQNYYLYEQNGKVTILPWDYNLAFGGFQSVSSSDAVNFPIDTPVSGVELSERPLIAKLLEVEEYKTLYHNYLSEIVTGYFDSGLFSNTINLINNNINQYVQKDKTAFYTYEEYKTAVDMLERFGLLRAQSIKGQLNGTIPSTTEGQKSDTSKLIDASTVTLSVMGSQGRGEGKEGQKPFGDDNFAQDTRQKIMKILESAENGILNDKQKDELKDLGVADEEINNMLSMVLNRKNGGNRDGGGQPQNFKNNQNPDLNNQKSSLISTNILICLIIILALFVSAFLFAVLFSRRKYQ